MEAEHEYFEQPAVSNPLFTHTMKRERIRQRNHVMVKNPFACPKVPPDIGVIEVHFPAKDDECRQSKKDGEQKRATKRLLVAEQEIFQLGHAAERHVEAMLKPKRTTGRGLHSSVLCGW